MANSPQSPSLGVADDKFQADDQVEQADSKGLDEPTERVIARPASLQNLSDDEFRQLDKRMVRKLDIVIVPIIGILYILNCM